MRNFALLLLCATVLGAGQGQALAQSAPMVISPAKATLLVGQSQSFQAADRTGRLQAKVSWMVSGPGIAQSQEGPELVFTARETGEFHVTARADGDFAEASIKVISGTALPIGTEIWSAPEYPGCTRLEIVPAPPSASGIDVYESEQCEDGTYLRAFTAEGIQKWRQKISGSPINASRLPGDQTGKADRTAPTGATHFNGPSISFCDRVTIGIKQADLRALLISSRLKAIDDPDGKGAWLIEEQGAQCRLWFDSNLTVIRKRKTLIAE
ncbi:MAG TPA: hypothetical protein VJW20_21710 [Candidatus Angelobacter sp.]|nr:hypothetical protein [Candidatus Angelobacter sp.]